MGKAAMHRDAAGFTLSLHDMDRLLADQWRCFPAPSTFNNQRTDICNLPLTFSSTMHFLALLLALCLSATATRAPVYHRKNGGKIDVGHIYGELWIVQRGNDYIVGKPGFRPEQLHYAIMSKSMDIVESSLRMSPAIGHCIDKDDVLQDQLIKISLALYQVLLNPGTRLQSFYSKPLLCVEYDMHPQALITPKDILLMAQALALNQRQENWSRRSISTTKGIKRRGTLRFEIAPESTLCV